MKRPLALWKSLVSEKTVNKETLLEMIFFLWTAENEVWFPILFIRILNPLHVSITNTFHVCICLVLQPPFPVPSSSALSTPYFLRNLPPSLPSGTCLCPQCFPSRSAPLCGPAIPLPPPTFLSSVWVSVWGKLGYIKVSFLYPDDRPG